MLIMSALSSEMVINIHFSFSLIVKVSIPVIINMPCCKFFNWESILFVCGKGLPRFLKQEIQLL